MRRLFWLAMGVTIGALVVRRISRAAEKLTPSGLAAGIGHGLSDLAESIGEFAADVATLEALLGRIRRRDGGAAWPPHPIFGRMSQRAWLRWAYLHMDHHLRQFGA